MSQVMHTVEQAAAKIRQGKRLMVAGDETALRRLPNGEWIGGTIPYFMADTGGLFTKQQIYVTELPDYAKVTGVKVYGESDIARVYNEIPVNGFGLILIPASSPMHLSFALNAPNYPAFANRPLLGWISGTHLDDLGKTTPKVFDGRQGNVLEDGAAVMHVQLPAGKVADINILNIFSQGNGDTLTFPRSGFTVADAFVNGEKRNFAEYIKGKGLDTRLPLVADYQGAMINVSFQSVNEKARKVELYAPVFTGVRYRHAAPVGDYVREFTRQMPETVGANIAFSCNCILNYLYSELEGKKTPNFTGPITFGEVAYQLLNQTMVYLTITDAAE